MIFSSACSGVRPRVQSLSSWLAGDLADGRLVDEGGVHMVGLQAGHGQHGAVLRQDGVALGVAGAGALPRMVEANSCREWPRATLRLTRSAALPSPSSRTTKSVRRTRRRLS